MAQGQQNGPVETLGCEQVSDRRSGHVCSYLPALAAEELSGVLDDLLIREEAVGLLLTQDEHLPQGDPKRPDVAGCGELAL